MSNKRLRRISILIGIAVFAITSCARVERREPPAAPPANATVSATPGARVEEITSSGQARRYRLHVSTKYQSGKTAPLVVNLHGYDSNAEQQENVSQMSAKADAVGFIVVYPEGLGSPQSWKFEDFAAGAADVAFIRDLIQRLATQFSIDANRVYATGISNGAEMSYRLMCDLSNTLAAAALVSGGYPPYRDCNPTRAVPVVVFHGTADNLISYEGRPPLMLPVREWAASWAARNGCAQKPQVTFQKGEVTGETWGGCRDNADVTLYTVNGKGHSWPGSNMPASITTKDIDATDVIWDFFAAHPKR